MKADNFITRADLMRDYKNLHRAYYRQFIEPWMTDKLLVEFGFPKIAAWYHNEIKIPWTEWDRLYTIPSKKSALVLKTASPSMRRKLRAAGDELSANFYLQVFVEAATCYMEHREQKR